MVPHTHWDREWYLPFAVYRRRLVELIDSLLLTLDSEPGLRFHLDGQMALVDDYLEARPDRLAALKEAAGAARISLGPWYTLPDEHLVSGECLIRNLELGAERAAQVGRSMPVGYLPDQFGHTAQMPQLLRRQGIETAVLWRGVPAAVSSTVFTWEALDGSSVEAIHLRRGYGHGRELPLGRAELGRRLELQVAADGEANPAGPWLVMSGDDHLPVPRGLARALERAEVAHTAGISTLEAYATDRPRPGSSWRGELHSAASSFVLKGTLSARFPLKLRHAALERRVERYLEPAFALGRERWPRREFAYLWRQLVLNSAHDSICGCSIDQVHEQATARLERGERLARNLWQRLGAPDATRLFNPSPFERDGVPPLAASRPAPAARPAGVDPSLLRLELEDGGDRGDEYTYDEPPGDRVLRTPLTGESTLGRGLRVRARAQARADEPFTVLHLHVENRRPDHRLRLLVPADTHAGGWAGVAFGAVHRPFQRPGSEEGIEYSVATHPARTWVDAGGVAVMMKGPFEYELLDDAIALTLLRCVGWLSRADLRNRPGDAGPSLKTPAAQMIGRHDFTVALYRHRGGWEEAQVPRWAEVFAHPLVAAPSGLDCHGPAIADPAVILSSLRREERGNQMRVYRCGTRGADPPPFGILDLPA